VFLAAESLTARTQAAISHARVPEIRALYLISRYSGTAAEIPFLFPAELAAETRSGIASALILSPASGRGTLRQRLPAHPPELYIDRHIQAKLRSGILWRWRFEVTGHPRQRISGARIHRKAPDWSTLRGSAYRFSKRHYPADAAL
jgi:hypothetical protein